MQTDMKLNKKIGLIILVLVIVSIVAALWAVSIFYNGPDFPFAERQHPSQDYISGDLEFFYIAQTVLSSINVVLLIILIITYSSIYVKTRSPFTIGLIIFSGALLMKDLFSNPIVIGAFGFHSFGLGPFVLIPDLFELAALIVLLYLSIEY